MKKDQKQPVLTYAEARKVLAPLIEILLPTEIRMRHELSVKSIVVTILLIQSTSLQESTLEDILAKEVPYFIQYGYSSYTSFKERPNGMTIEQVNLWIQAKYPKLEVAEHDSSESAYWYSDDEDLRLHLAGLPETTITHPKYITSIEELMLLADEVMKEWVRPEGAMIME